MSIKEYSMYLNRGTKVNLMKTQKVSFGAEDHTYIYLFGAEDGIQVLILAR